MYADPVLQYNIVPILPPENLIFLSKNPTLAFENKMETVDFSITITDMQEGNQNIL